MQLSHGDAQRGLERSSTFGGAPQTRKTRKQCTVLLVVLVLLQLSELALGQDPVVDQTIAQLSFPCSCDCCQVMPRQPDEIVQLANNVTLEHKCAPPEVKTDLCPDQCEASNADVTLRSSVAEMDYMRYCAYKCKPVTVTPGSSCVRLNFQEISQAAEESGNGNSDAPFLVMKSNAKSTWETATEQAAVKVLQEAKKAKQVSDMNQEVVWDMRNLISQRLRAEAGSAMARGSAAAARTQANEHAAERVATLAARVTSAVQPRGAEVEGATVGVAAEAEAAIASGAKSQLILKKAQAEASNLIADAKRLAVAEVKKQAAVAARQEAKAYATIQGWDKPSNWGKALAVRASEPYMQAMVSAVTRVSEYEGFARNLLGQAKGSQAKAQTLSAHANLMGAHGDKLGAATEWNQVKQLISKSEALQSQAQRFWLIADNTRKTIPEWQGAGAMAASRNAFEFEHSFTPSP